MFRVEISSEICKACGFCISVCPKKILDFGASTNSMGYTTVQLIQQEGCIGCTSCAVICPDAAISIYKED